MVVVNNYSHYSHCHSVLILHCKGGGNKYNKFRVSVFFIHKFLVEMQNLGCFNCVKLGGVELHV